MRAGEQRIHAPHPGQPEGGVPRLLCHPPWLHEHGARCRCRQQQLVEAEQQEGLAAVHRIDIVWNRFFGAHQPWLVFFLLAHVVTACCAQGTVSILLVYDKAPLDGSKFNVYFSDVSKSVLGPTFTNVWSGSSDPASLQAFIDSMKANQFVVTTVQASGNSLSSINVDMVGSWIIPPSDGNGGSSQPTPPPTTPPPPGAYRALQHRVSHVKLPANACLSLFEQALRSPWT